MESENSIGFTVKNSDDKKAKKVRRHLGRIPAHEVRDRRTFNLFLRFQGRLHGVFIRKGKGRTLYYDWRNEDFARISGRKGGKAVPLRTVERQFPRFQRWCDEYRFDKIMSRRPGDAKATWAVRVTPNNGVALAVPGATIRERLQGAVLAYVAKGGRCKVDRAFCAKFAGASGLPLVAVETIWLRLEKFGGLKVRWRGEGRGQKFVVERPERWAEICAERKLQILESQTRKPPPRSAFLRNERLKDSGRAPEGPEESARAAPAGRLAPGETGRAGDSPPEPGGFEHPEIVPYFGRWFPGCKPLQICGRLVSARKLQKLSAWIAGQKLKFVHDEFPRVRFVFLFARNFALAALRFGYQLPAIEHAWRSGVAKSHADSADAGEYPEDPRVPSAARSYAWAALRAADGRPAAALWAEFFAAPRRAREPRPASKPARADPRAGTGAGAGTRPARGSGLLAELREMVARPSAPRDNLSPAESRAVTAGEVVAYLKAKHDGMTMAQFAALPWRVRQGFIKRAAEWKQNERAD